MNWVDKRYAVEQALKNGAPTLWNQVRAAIQDACDSFNQQFGEPLERRVVCELENGSRVRIEKQLRHQGEKYYQDRDHSVVVTFEERPAYAVSVAGSGPLKSARFAIDSDEQDAFLVVAGNRLSPEEVSQRILEPLLFPAGKYSHTR